MSDYEERLTGEEPSTPEPYELPDSVHYPPESPSEPYADVVNESQPEPAHEVYPDAINEPYSFDPVEDYQQPSQTENFIEPEAIPEPSAEPTEEMPGQAELDDLITRAMALEPLEVPEASIFPDYPVAPPMQLGMGLEAVADANAAAAPLRESPYSDRVEELTYAIQRHPEAPVNYVLRAEVLLDNRNWDEAFADFEKALELIEVRAETDKWEYIDRALADRAHEGLRRLRR